MGGGKGGGSSSSTSPYDRVMAQIAQTEYERAAPLRDAYMGQYQQILDGNYDPKTSPMYSSLFNSLRSAAGQGEAQARDQILSSTARGGGQTAALSDLYRTSAQDRANTSFNAQSSILGDLLNQMYGTAAGSPAAAIQGLGAAGNLATNSAMAQNQSNMLASQQGSALGGSLGTLAGAGLMAGLGPFGMMTNLGLGALGGGSLGRGIGGKK